MDKIEQKPLIEEMNEVARPLIREYSNVAFLMATFQVKLEKLFDEETFGEIDRDENTWEWLRSKILGEKK